MRRRTAIVTDAGLAAGITVARSLARAGWRVVAVDSSPLSPAFVSRFVRERHLIASPELAPVEAAERLVRIAHATGADLIVPVTDQVLFPLLGRVADLPRTTVVAAAGTAALDVARFKDRTLELAGRVDVPVPAWRLATTVDDVRRYGAELGWPVVCKPVVSHASTTAGPLETRAVTFARSIRHLDEQLAAGTVQTPVLVQQYVAGTGLGIDVLCHEGRVLAAFQHRRLREFPIWGGMSSSRVSEPLDPYLLKLAQTLLEPLAWSGLAMVEFRSTAAGPLLMEINGRVWGSIALPVRAGMDFPAKLAELCTAGPPLAAVPIDQNYRVGIECRNLALELRWAAQAVRRPATPTGEPPGPRTDAIGVLTGLFNPRNNFDVQILADPLPGITDAVLAIAQPLLAAGRRASASWRSGQRSAGA